MLGAAIWLVPETVATGRERGENCTPHKKALKERAIWNNIVSGNFVIEGIKVTRVVDPICLN